MRPRRRLAALFALLLAAMAVASVSAMTTIAFATHQSAHSPTTQGQERTQPGTQPSRHPIAHSPIRHRQAEGQTQQLVHPVLEQQRMQRQ